MFKAGLRAILSTVLSAGLALGMGTQVRAQQQYPSNAPAELKVFLSELETAANRHDADGVMAFYSPDFSNSDNLDREQLSRGLQNLWEKYANLNYYTELESWETQGDRVTLETVTYVTGTRMDSGREMRLKSTVRSRQYLQGQQILRQEILSERTEITLGDNPPQVDFNLPDRVRPGEQFNFDAIVKEPLGEDLLLGAAVEEQVSGESYFNFESFDLELLQAGGLFKQGTAPTQGGDRWISAILIRGDGITIITQRLRVTETEG